VADAGFVEFSEVGAAFAVSVFSALATKSIARPNTIAKLDPTSQ
jgi:hypothetical protein